MTAFNDTGILSEVLDSEESMERLLLKSDKNLRGTSASLLQRPPKSSEGVRNLQELNTADIGLFSPLRGNVDLSDCSHLFSSLVGGPTDVVTVPINTCYTWDMAEDSTVTIGGLDIHGKLVVPKNYKGTLKTNFVFVQGVFEMSDDNPISPENTSMRIILTGEADVTFTPADSNSAIGSFNAGSKPFLVAGGQLNIRGWDGSLEEGGLVDTWTPLIGTAEQDPPNPVRNVSLGVGGEPYTEWTLAGAEEYPLDPPPGCSRQVVNHDFNDDPHLELWTAGDGQIIHHENGTLTVHDTINTNWQGFKLDFR